ncbi:MAG: hypothetical protein DHS80DRAFT_31168 [Piptocephalis tieghemiana]|nr:MAG: hypothetical protein DHS80DRAFT_31168 [Piptocephalis tieghemiana]
MKPIIYSCSTAISKRDSSYEGKLVKFTPPTYMTELTNNHESIAIHTRGCKLDGHLLNVTILGHFNEAFDGISHAFLYQRLNLTGGKDLSCRSRGLVTIEMTNLPLLHAPELLTAIQGYLDSHFKVHGIMI